MKTNEFIKEKTTSYNIRFLNDDVLFSALQEATKTMEMSPSRYIKIALRDKLKEDGFLKPGQLVIIKGPGRRTNYSK